MIRISRGNPDLAQDETGVIARVEEINEIKGKNKIN